MAVDSKPLFTVADFAHVRPLANALLTTNNPSEHTDAIEALTLAQCHALDSIVFECQMCNHWFEFRERKEFRGEFYCKDCAQFDQ